MFVAFGVKPLPALGWAVVGAVVAHVAIFERPIAAVLGTATIRIRTWPLLKRPFRAGA